MLHNFLTITLRNFYKTRYYTLINVFGLTVGITACLIIFLYVRFELSYDRFNENADRIVRVDWDLQMAGTRTYNAAVTPPMAEAFVRDYPEVEAAARMRYTGSSQFKVDTEAISDWRIVYADNSLFSIFTIPFVKGDPSTALKDPWTMVITESCAQQLFPNQDPVGQTILKDNKDLYKITGVVKDIPDNSHFHYRMFLSMEGLEESKNSNWIGGPFNTYLLLREGTKAADLEAKLPGMVEKYILPSAEITLGASFVSKFQEAGNTLTLRLRPLTDIHLHSNLRNELETNGDIDYVYLFSGIAIFTLIIASINFVNLSTARSARRAREVGIRKIVGSSRKSLAFQFIGESTILSLTAFIFSVAIAQVVLPSFNALTGTSLSIPFKDLAFVVGAFCTALLVGILSGIYPGIVLSSFQPADVLKNKAGSRGGSFFRNTLVTFQFAVSIFLIIGTIVLYQQMDFLQSRKLGFEPQQVVLLKDVKNLGDRLTSIKEEMLKLNGFQSGTVSSYFPGPGFARKTPLIWKYGTDPLPGSSVNAETWTVDHDYVKTLQIDIVRGRNFSPDFPSDSSAVILNETALAQLDLSGDPIGQKISTFRDTHDGRQEKSQLITAEIIGIAKDFNFESLRQHVAPLALFYGKSHGALAFRIATDNTPQAISTLEKKWKQLAPGEPFHFAFLDENFQSLYDSEAKVSRVFALFAGLAIVIACMGLFALVAYTTEQRTREVGIRKVLGASLYSIVLLLTREYGKLIITGFIVASALAVFGIRWYLQDYAYRIEVGWWIFAGAGVITFLLAFTTMAYHSLTAAKSNPVDALKSDS